MTRLWQTATKRRRRRGLVTFEWILLISLLVIGIIGGLAAVRNALLCELVDLSECIESMNVCGGNPDCDASGCPPDNPNCCDDNWWCPSCGGP
ncbi:MAG: hypothetical protein JW818_09560 [Pirellulales bacterium]|nr:hypothetical protein [Pirellulales bacterium]